MSCFTPLAFDIHKESLFAFAQNAPAPLSGDTAVCIGISVSLYACSKALECVISEAASLGNLQTETPLVSIISQYFFFSLFIFLPSLPSNTLTCQVTINQNHLSLPKVLSLERFLTWSTPA